MVATPRAPVLRWGKVSLSPLHLSLESPSPGNRKRLFLTVQLLETQAFDRYFLLLSDFVDANPSRHTISYCLYVPACYACNLQRLPI